MNRSNDEDIILHHDRSCPEGHVAFVRPWGAECEACGFRYVRPVPPRTSEPVVGIPTIPLWPARLAVRAAEVGFAVGACVIVSTLFVGMVAVVGLRGIGGRR